MPSNTFLNLEKRKQEKLLTAAKHEFSKETFANASINQIIKEAKISRGSFYMYFEDKEDLYQYLLQQSIEKTYDKMVDTLRTSNGDIFYAFESLFDMAIVGCIKTENKAFVKQVVENMRLYKEKQEMHCFLKEEHRKEIEKQINYNELNPLAKKHIGLVMAQCFHIFMWNLIKLLRDEEDEKTIKQNFKEQIKLLQKGVKKERSKDNV